MTKELELEISKIIKENYECDIIINETSPYTYYSITDIEKIIGLKNIRQNITNIEEKYKKKFIRKTNGGNQNKLFVTYDGLLKLIIKSRKIKCIDFAKKIKLDIKTKYYTAIETDIIKCIMTTFESLHIKDQYSIDTYFVDLYFIEYNLIIECDENHHNRTINKENDIIRQEYISKKIDGCKFIRFNPYSKNFNLYKLLNNIFLHITSYKKKS